MESFGERLRRMRDERGISVNELARRTGKDPGGISRIERGLRWGGKQPPADDIAIFADAIGVTFDELRGVDGSGEPLEPEPEIQRMPLAELLRRIGARPYRGNAPEDIAASAGSGYMIPHGFDDGRKINRGRAKDDPLQDVLVTGDCMVDLIHPGDVVTFDTRRMPDLGEVVVAVRYGDETIVKLLREKDGYQYLTSVDGKTIIPLTREIRILGPVVLVQQSMRRLLHEWTVG